MDKLSERLWVMRVSLENLTDDELATFDEAIEKAKRYEDAPVRMVGDAMSYGVSAAGTGIKNGQRVRIVLDKEE